MNNIDTIMYLIDWSRSSAEQQEGIRMARDVKCLKAFFQPSGPGYCKSVWDNCAKIVCERSDEELVPYTSDMLAWLEDLNWPGTMCVVQRLKQFNDVSILAFSIEEMLPALVALKEIPWLMCIAELLDNQKLKKQLKDSTVQFLTEVPNIAEDDLASRYHNLNIKNAL